MSSLPEVLKLLPKLSVRELSEVKTRVEFLAGQPKNNVGWLIQGLSAELRRRGLVAGECYVKLDVEQVKKSIEVQTFLLEGYGNNSPATVERLALAQFAGFTLAEYLSKLKIPLGPKTLFTNIDKIPVALEESFPGYWASRAFGLCLIGGGRGRSSREGAL